MKFRLGFALLVLACCAFRATLAEDKFKLELLQVLFRHGDRAAAAKEIYKDDPHEEVFRKIGFGQLTKAGKNREYEIGQQIRTRYVDFLGPEFHYEDVYAYSSDFDRTKMSLHLALAGLYPSTETTAWNEKLPWIPIPTHYNSTKSCLFKSFEECVPYKKLLDAAEKSKDIQEARKPHLGLLKRVQEVTGIKNISSSTIFYLRNNLRSALGLGLPLPTWCSHEDYENLKSIARLMYVEQSSTQTLKKIVAGPAIELYLNNIDKHERKENKRKLYVYCAHDNNLATFNIVHNFTGVPDLPDYGSTLVIEKLRGVEDGRVYLRMFMWTGVTGEWISLKMPNCAAECPLDEYRKLVEFALPDEETRKCVEYVPKCI